MRVTRGLLLVLGCCTAGFWYYSGQVELDSRRLQLNREVAAALDESAQHREKLHQQLGDPLQVHVLLSDIDQWETKVQTARAAWQRAKTLAESGPELLEADVAPVKNEPIPPGVPQQRDRRVQRVYGTSGMDGSFRLDGVRRRFQQVRVALQRRAHERAERLEREDQAEHHRHGRSRHSRAVP